MTNNIGSNGPIPMSPDGIKKLERDLNELTQFARPDMLKSLQEAREKGDLSENAEYSAAREGLTQIDIQIGRLQKLLSRVISVDQAEISTDRVGLLNLVKLHNMKLDKEVLYRIVAPEEADPRSGKISSTSPVGAALIGKVIGDKIEVEVPSGLVSYKVMEISK